MTTTPTRPNPGYVDHTLVGTPDQIATVIRRHHQAGTFIAMAAPQSVAPNDPRIRVQIRLSAPAATATSAAGRRARTAVRTRSTPAQPTRKPTPTTTTRSHRGAHGRRLGLALTITTAVIGLLFTIGYLAARATADAVAHAAATVAGFAVIAAIATAVLRGGSGGKRHCPGCD